VASTTRTGVEAIGNGVGYQLAPNESWAPGAVFAFWDGSGAAGDFVPAVSFYSPAGVLMDRAFPDGVTLSPGDTAEVSYRPFKRGGGGGAALETTNGITTISPTRELLIGSGLVLFDFGGGIAFLEADVAPDVYADLAANTPNVYAFGAKVPLNTFGNAPFANGVTVGADSVTLTDAGVYLITASFFVSYVPTAPGAIVLNVLLKNDNPAFAGGLIMQAARTQIDAPPAVGVQSQFSVTLTSQSRFQAPSAWGALNVPTYLTIDNPTGNATVNRPPAAGGCKAMFTVLKVAS